MPLRRTATWMLVPLLALAGLSACSDSDGSSKTPRPSGTPGGGATSAAAATPDWSAVTVPAAAQPSHEIATVQGTVPAAGKQPALAVGYLTQPDGSSASVFWHPGAGGMGKAVPFGVSGESSADDVDSNGTLTVVSGSVWSKGTVTPYVRTSTDRRTWTDVAIPDAVGDRELELSEVVALPGGTVAAFGLDPDHHPMAVDLGSGRVTELPAASGGELSDFSDAAAHGRTIVVVASGQAKDGTPTHVGYRSTDAGHTWKRVAAPRGEQVVLRGIVALRNGFLATGSRQTGGDAAPAAWFSADGTHWRTESVPAPRDHDAGWDALLGDATVSGGTVYAAERDEEARFAPVLQRSPRGTWSVFGEASSWVSPDLDTSVVATADGLATIRSWNGALQSGVFTQLGSWQSTGESDAAAGPVSWIDSLDLVDDSPALVGGREVVRPEGEDGWSRTDRLAHFSVSGSRLRRSGWEPKAAAGVTGVAAATADDGTAVVLGEKEHSQDHTDASDVVGWVKHGSTWKPVTGLKGPRSEFLHDLAVHGRQWVAVGAERASWTISDHSFGALWLSGDGRSWKRASGPFDVDPKHDSSLSGSCRLPNGDLLAVGYVENDATGSAPLVFERAKGGWKRVSFRGLGDGVHSLSSCASAGEVTLIQGVEGSHERLWSTTDGVHVTPVTVGESDDVIGDVVAFPGGFVAPGGRYQGNASQPVVWLSKDGRTWVSVDVPAGSPMYADTVLPWDERLLVASTDTNGGPHLSVLANPADLLGG